ncbi:MAG: hypothetical protein ACK5IC_08690 [Moheibacter sp.]
MGVHAGAGWKAENFQFSTDGSQNGLSTANLRKKAVENRFGE